MLSYRKVFVLRRLPDGTIISIVGWKMLKARVQYFKLQPESWSPWRTSLVSIWAEIGQSADGRADGGAFDLWGQQVREWCGCCQVDSQPEQRKNDYIQLVKQFGRHIMDSVCHPHRRGGSGNTGASMNKPGKHSQQMSKHLDGHVFHLCQARTGFTWNPKHGFCPRSCCLIRHGYVVIICCSIFVQFWVRCWSFGMFVIPLWWSLEMGLLGPPPQQLSSSSDIAFMCEKNRDSPHFHINVVSPISKTIEYHWVYHGFTIYLYIFHDIKNH